MALGCAHDSLFRNLYVGATEAAEPEEEPLLARARAAEHVLHAIAGANHELLTPGVLCLLGPAEVTASTTIAHWDFAGHAFAMSGACAVLGAAAVVSAPLEAPTILISGAAFALTHGLSALGGADGEIQRLAHANEFKSKFGFDRTELLWSLIPPATLYWHLQPGDTVLELALKAKRGALGLGENPHALGKILRALLNAQPGAAADRAGRLEAAIHKAASDMGVEPMDESLAPAWRVVAAARSGDLALATASSAAAASWQERAASAGARGFDDEIVLVLPSMRARYAREGRSNSTSASGRHGRIGSVGTSIEDADTPRPTSEMCSICLAEKRSYALIPCGHRCRTLPPRPCPRHTTIRTAR